jgi:hypothetical protein
MINILTFGRQIITSKNILIFEAFNNKFTISNTKSN